MADGTKYDGSFKQNKFHGRGTCRWPDKRYYDGYWVDGLMEDDNALFQWPEGITYRGGYKKGLKHGKGTLEWNKKDTRSEDNWVNGLREGKGKIFWANGTMSKVTWMNGEMIREEEGLEVEQDQLEDIEEDHSL